MKTLMPVVLLILVVLAGCQDSQRSLNGAPDVASPNAVMEGIPEPISASQASIPIPGPVYTAAYRNHVQDTDQDGIPDAEDPNPYAAPERPQSGPTLAITNLATSRVDRVLTDWIMAGEPVHLETTGMHHYGGPWWVRWHHANGILASAVVPDANGRVTVMAPEVMPYAVSVVAGYYGSDLRGVHSQMAGAPLLYPVVESLKAGETVSLEGEHLDRIDRLWLEEDEQVFAATPERLELILPVHPSGTTLIWQDTQGRLHEQTLPLLRPVQFEAAVALDDASGWHLITDDQVHQLDEPLTLWLAAGESWVLRWTRNDRSHSALSLVLPTTRQVTVGAGNMLDAWLWSYRTGQGGSRQLDFSRLLPHWRQQLGYIEADLWRALNGDASAFNEALQAFNQSASGVIESTEPLIIQSRWGILNYLSDTLDAIFAGGPLYEPIVNVTNLRAKPGSANYANIGIGYERDLITCGTLSFRPANIWPSDLCVENDSAVFISVRVVDWRSEEVMDDHIVSALDPNIIGGTSMGILNLSNVSFLTGTGGALCKMRPCRIEVLTGGIGLYTTPQLSNQETRIANWLVARTLMDRMVLPIIEEITGLRSDSSVLSCFAQKLLNPKPAESIGYMISIAEFSLKVEQSSSVSEVIGHTLETVVMTVLEKMQGMATDPDFAPCLLVMSADAKNQVLSNTSQRLSRVASSAAVPVRVAQVVTTLYNQWEVLTNPRKIVFEVSPRAAITRVTTSSGVRQLYADSPSDFLRLYGTHLVDPLPDGYYPDLVLTDRSGKTARMTITPDEVFDASDMSWVDLRIPVATLQPLINQLSGSRFDVMLEMSHTNFDGFPDGVLRLPAIHFDWIGDARLIGTNTGLIRAGDFGEIFGENLELFRRPDLQMMFSLPDQSMYMARNVTYRNARSIAFTLPEAMPSGTYEVHLLAEGFEPLASDSPVEVIAANASYIRVLDNGENQDDRMFVSLYNEDKVLSVKGGSTLFVIPTQNTNNYDIWIGWEAGDLTDSDGVPRDLTGIHVECIDGGDDGICTMRMVGDVYRSDGVRVRFDEQDTLDTGDEFLAQ